ncbi:MAG TPA: tryptophan synthase subunit alpha [Ktedonobacteraceae bacterium]
MPAFASSNSHGIPPGVGFDLSTPEHLAEVTSYADGAVIGSALVNLIDQHEESAQAEAVRKYPGSLSPRKAR